MDITEDARAQKAARMAIMAITPELTIIRL
jgi:hypothetical protein